MTIYAIFLYNLHTFLVQKYIDYIKNDPMILVHVYDIFSLYNLYIFVQMHVCSAHMAFALNPNNSVIKSSVIVLHTSFAQGNIDVPSSRSYEINLLLFLKNMHL